MASSDDPTWHRLPVTVLLWVLLSALITYKALNTPPFPNRAEIESLAVAQQLAEDQLNFTQLEVEHLARGPGYPLILSALARDDANLKAGLSCHATGITCTASAFTRLFIVQVILAVLSLIAIFLTAWIMSGSWSVAILTLVFTFIAGSFGAIAGQLNALIWPQSLMLFSLLCLARAATSDALVWTCAAGTLLGLATLFMPQFFLVGLIAAVSFPILSARIAPVLKQPARHMLVLVTAMLATLAVVMVTTDASIIQSAITAKIADGFEARGRLSALTGWDHLSLLLSPIPILGGLAKNLFALSSPEHLAELAARTPATHNPAQHLIATPGIFLRGLWVGTPILTILGLLHIKPLLKFSNEDLRLGPTLFVALPIFTLVIINTCLTANPPENNVGLVLVLAYATAYLVGRTDIRRRYWANKSAQKTEAAAT